MSGYIGSWKIDDLLTFTIVTHTVTTGAATDADSAPAYRVYEDETSTPILTGTMALLDSANTAGFYSEQITLSAANGFEKGKSYNIYIQATVNSVIGATVRTLQIEAEVDANVVSDKTGYTAATVTDKTGYALTAAYDPAKTAATQTSVDDLPTNAELATSQDAADDATLAQIALVKTETDKIASIKTKTDQFVFTVANQVDANTLTGGGSGLDAAGVRAAIGLATANLDTQLDAVPTAAETATAVLSAATSNPIDANVQEINDTEIVGNGVSPKFGV